MAEINKKQIAAMQDEFLKLQKIELGLRGDNTKTARLLREYGSMTALYYNQKKLDALMREIDGIIMDLANTGRVRGKIMSLKTMNEYLSKAERANKTQRVLDMIDRANNRKAAKRAEIYALELAKEKGILKADIELFIKQAELSGLSQKEILKQLVKASQIGTGPVEQFKRRIESVERDVLRREASASEIDEYNKAALPGEKWEWITISTKPCPDCQIRAGVILSYDEWKDRGFPGDGRTICRSSCMCKLMPVSVADDLFPDVKTFNWNKESGVLTTAGEMRTFGAKGNK